MYGRITLQYDSKKPCVGDSIEVDTRVGRLTIETNVAYTSFVLIGWDGSVILERHYENRDFPSDSGKGE